MTVLERLCVRVYCPVGGQGSVKQEQSREASALSGWTPMVVSSVSYIAHMHILYTSVQCINTEDY